MVNSFFFHIFLKTKFSIRLTLRQFLFEVNRISIHGDILKKPCASHHASTHISEKLCFHLKQKTSTGQLSCPAFQLSIE